MTACLGYSEQKDYPGNIEIITEKKLERSSCSKTSECGSYSVVIECGLE